MAGFDGDIEFLDEPAEAVEQACPADQEDAACARIGRKGNRFTGLDFGKLVDHLGDQGEELFGIGLMNGNEAVVDLGIEGRGIELLDDGFQQRKIRRGSSDNDAAGPRIGHRDDADGLGRGFAFLWRLCGSGLSFFSTFL